MHPSIYPFLQSFVPPAQLYQLYQFYQFAYYELLTTLSKFSISITSRQKLVTDFFVIWIPQ